LPGFVSHGWPGKERRETMVTQQMNVHRHWSRRAEGVVVVFASVICSLASAHTVWWFLSGMNWMDNLQWVVSILLALVFIALGFVISRSVAHRMQHKQRLGMVLAVALLYEVVEIGCCFTYAAIGIQHVTWLPLLHGGLHSFVSALCYIILPITPLFTIGLGNLEVSLDREKHGQEAPAAPIRQQPVPLNFQTTAGAARPIVPPYMPPQQTTNFNTMAGTPPYNAGYAPQQTVAPQAGYPPMPPYQQAVR
jgi:uncharacterized membrane protein YesL